MSFLINRRFCVLQQEQPRANCINYLLFHFRKPRVEFDFDFAIRIVDVFFHLVHLLLLSYAPSASTKVVCASCAMYASGKRATG